MPSEANRSYPPRITIQVTKEDIRHGKRYKPNSCPIALATRRQFPGRPIAVAGAIEIGRGDALVFYLLSERGQKFIDDFDQGLPVTPTRFRAVHEDVFYA